LGLTVTANFGLGVASLRILEKVGWPCPD